MDLIHAFCVPASEVAALHLHHHHHHAPVVEQTTKAAETLLMRTVFSFGFGVSGDFGPETKLAWAENEF